MIPRPSPTPGDKKVRIVLRILSGEMSVTEAAERADESVQITWWKRQFLKAGRARLLVGAPPSPTARERELLGEIEELKTALGETYAELRALRMRRAPHGEGGAHP